MRGSMRRRISTTLGFSALLGAGLITAWTSAVGLAVAESDENCTQNCIRYNGPDGSEWLSGSTDDWSNSPGMSAGGLTLFPTQDFSGND